MIQSIEIKNLRGIRRGKLEGLSPLTVLVGPNGCGKSTILDALLVGASPKAQQGLRVAQRRHDGLGKGNRWFLWRADADVMSTVAIETASGMRSVVRLHLHPTQGVRERYRQKSPRREQPPENPQHPTAGSHAGQEETDGFSGIKLVDTQVARAPEPPLTDLFTEAVRGGRRDEAIDIVTAAIPGAMGIEILTEAGTPVLHVVFSDHSVPVPLAGDGTYALLRLSLAVASSAGGIVLLEEPEIHQHPGTIYRSARAIRAAVKRGIQVVLTTHSLELIDALLSKATEEDLQALSVFRLNLNEGILVSHRLPGPDVVRARREIEDDLR